MVIYPIIDLLSLPAGSSVAGKPKCYVDGLEAVTIATLASHGVVGKRTTNTGVWIDDEHKIASIGVHLRRNVTSHGVAINVHTDLDYFRHIVACGLADKAATSLHAIGRTEVTVDIVRQSFVRTFAEAFGYGGVVEQQEVP